MKLDVFVMTADATVATNYENLNAIAINFVDANEINSSNIFINFVVSNANINMKKVLFADITIYDDVDTRTKFANLIANYSNL